MLNWFRKKKKEDSDSVSLATEDKGLIISCTVLSTENKLDNSQVIPIKDKRIIGRLATISPEIARIMAINKMTQDAVKSVKSIGDVYRIVLSHGGKLLDSKSIIGAKRGAYLDVNNKLHQANLVSVNGRVEGALQNVVKNQMIGSALNVASMIVGQYYMSQINCELDKISKSINCIEQFQESEYISKITTLLKEMKKMEAFQISSLTNEDTRKEKIRLLYDMEKECTQLLDQATISINTIMAKPISDFKEYENAMFQIEKWKEYQRLLLEVLYQISLLMQVFCMGQELEEVFFIFNQCENECERTYDKLKEYHLEQQSKLKIDISTNLISNGRFMEGIASVVGIFDEEVKDKIRQRKLPLKTAEILSVQMKSFERKKQEVLPLGEDVDIIIRNGEFFYLPSKN